MKAGSKKRALLLSLLALMLAIALSLYVSAANRRIFDISSSSLKELYSSLNDSFISHTEKQWSMLEALRPLLEAGDGNVTPEYLAGLRDTWGFTEFFFINESGDYISADGGTGYFSYGNTYHQLIENNENIVTNATDSERGMLTLFAVPATGQWQGTAFTAIAVGYDREQVGQLISAHAYEGSTESFIVRGRGSVLLSNSDKAEYSIYAAVSGKGSSLDTRELTELRLGLESGGENVMKFTLNGERYYLIYLPVGIADLMIVGLVPVRIFDASTKNLQMLTIAAAALMMTILAVSAWIGRREKQRTMAAVIAAEAESRAKSSFLANMSHDIRTPINAIVGLSTLLDKDAGDEAKVRLHTKKIQSSSRHLLELINNVLDMSKIESGKLVINSSDFSLLDVAEEMDVLIRPQAEAKNQTFSVDTAGMRDPWVTGDRVHLNQVLLNLLSNAVKYTPDGGSVRFTLIEEAEEDGIGQYIFTVKDNGIGMSSDYMRHIFDPFTREQSTLTNYVQGTGLGMSITKKIVDALDGTISIASSKGSGSTFTVRLSFPLAVPPAETPAAADGPREEAGNVFAGRHFLVAEDNELNQEIIHDLLEMMDATCDIAENGREAVEKFAASAPGTYYAVFMDVQMPVMNGYEATEALRRLDHPEAASIHVIAMTANAFDEDIRNALNAGMDAHVAKPVDMKLLARVLEDLDKGKAKEK